LGALCTVYSLSLRWDGGYYAEIFKVQHSRDGENWETAADCEGRPGEQMIVIKPTEASHIRLLMLKPAKDKYSLIETEIYGEGGADYKNEGGWRIRRPRGRRSGEAFPIRIRRFEWLAAVVPERADLLARAGAIQKSDIAIISSSFRRLYHNRTTGTGGALRFRKRKGRAYAQFQCRELEGRRLAQRQQLGKIWAVYEERVRHNDFAVLGGVYIFACIYIECQSRASQGPHPRNPGPNAACTVRTNPTIHASKVGLVTTVRGRTSAFMAPCSCQISKAY
jgi:hypothetical protein